MLVNHLYSDQLKLTLSFFNYLFHDYLLHDYHVINGNLLVRGHLINSDFVVLHSSMISPNGFSRFVTVVNCSLFSVGRIVIIHRRVISSFVVVSRFVMLWSCFSWQTLLVELSRFEAVMLATLPWCNFLSSKTFSDSVSASGQVTTLWKTTDGISTSPFGQRCVWSVHFRTFWDVMGQFGRLYDKFGALRPFSPIIGSLKRICYGQTDGWTDGQMDGQTLL